MSTPVRDGDRDGDGRHDGASARPRPRPRPGTRARDRVRARARARARVAAVRGVWEARSARTRHDRWYRAYVIVALGLVVVAPVARLVWTTAVSAGGVAALTSAQAPGAAGIVVASLIGAALVLGRERGPVSSTPLLVFALATADLPRLAAFRRPLVRAGAALVVSGAGAAAVIGATLVRAGAASPGAALLFVVAGALVGVVILVSWLVGQAAPCAAGWLAAGAVATAVVGRLVPAASVATPGGWVERAYPVGGIAPPEIAAVLSLVASVAAALAVTPWLLARLRPHDLLAQASRWEAASSLVSGVDLAGATAIYRSRPRVGRRFATVRPSRWRAWTFVRRDAIGAARTPVRLALGVMALAGGGVLLGAATSTGAASSAVDSTVLLGTAAGLVVFAGLGPITDGLRHAAAVAGDVTLYGVGDPHLLGLHALFPLVLTVVVLVTAGVVTAGLVGPTAGGAVPLASAAAAVLSLGVRATGALKGPMPPALLLPVSSPAGDPMALVRVIWAVDGLVLAGLVGGSAALAAATPVPLVVSATLLGVVGAARWRWRA